MSLRALLAALCSSLAVGLPLRLAKGALEGVRQADSAQLIADTQEAQRPSILWVQNIGEFILGSILVLLSLTASWFFERQLARLECLVSIGRNNCVSVTEAQEKNWGQLLHIKGDLRAEAPIKDPRFESEVRGTARLRTRVQVFVPGTGWSENVRGAGTRITNSSLVKLDGFVVPDGLLDQLGSFSCLSSVLGLEVRGSDGKAYQRHSDGFYYWRSGKCTAQQIAEAPCEKDLRASFEQSSAKATVLALQAPVKDEMVLLPYRLVPQVYDQEEQRALRVQEARKSRIRMAGEDQICPRSWLCCSCNFVAGSCTGVKTPEIFHLFEGERGREECFRDLRGSMRVNLGLESWTFRLLVLAVMIVGMYMSFSNALLRAYALSFTNVARFGTSSCVAVSLTFTIIGAAFLPYLIRKPCLYLALAVLVLLLPLLEH